MQDDIADEHRHREQQQPVAAEITDENAGANNQQQQQIQDDPGQIYTEPQQTDISIDGAQRQE